METSEQSARRREREAQEQAEAWQGLREAEQVLAQMLKPPPTATEVAMRLRNGQYSEEWTPAERVAARIRDRERVIAEIEADPHAGYEDDLAKLHREIAALQERGERAFEDTCNGE
jgi:hypothetical protein